jgi:hypothetical protein
VKVSNNKGIASHIGPESCAGEGNHTGEALTGEQAGWVLSPEIGLNFRAPTVLGKREGHTVSALVRAKGGLCGVGGPIHAWRHSERESGEPVSARREDGRLGCIGKSEDTSQ